MVIEFHIAWRYLALLRHYFKDLFGMDFSYGWEVQGQKIKVRSELISGTQLQFIQATAPESVVAKFIKAKG